MSKNSYSPQIGDYLMPDQWIYGSWLKESDGYSDSEFPGCQFRLPTQNCHPYELAINITVTGRDFWVPTYGQYRCRCKIEFVGDGEESTFSGGWLYHN